MSALEKLSNVVDFDPAVEKAIKAVSTIKETLKTVEEANSGASAWKNKFLNADESPKAETGALYYEVNGVYYALELPTADIASLIDAQVNTKKASLEAVTLADLTK